MHPAINVTAAMIILRTAFANSFLLVCVFMITEVFYVDGLGGANFDMILGRRNFERIE